MYYHHVTKSVTKKRACGWCKRKFKPEQRGRPRLYCSRSCRQRAYESRSAERRLPELLLGNDIDDIRTKAGIERAVIRVLRELDFLPKAKGPQPQLRLIKDDEDS